MKVRRDPRWVLAFLAILCAFALQAYLTIQCANGATARCEAEAPQWVVGLVSSVVAYYFGARNGKAMHPSEMPYQQRGETSAPEYPE